MGVEATEGADFSFEVLPVLLTDPVLVEKYTQVIRSWGREDGKAFGTYEGEISDISVHGSFLSFSHNNINSICSIEPPDYNRACTSSIQRALYRNLGSAPERIASILC